MPYHVFKKNVATQTATQPHDWYRRTRGDMVEEKKTAFKHLSDDAVETFDDLAAAEEYRREMIGGTSTTTDRYPTELDPSQVFNRSEEEE